MKDNVLTRLENLSNLQQQADMQLRELKYDNRNLHPNAVETVTPAGKVNRLFHSLRYKVCTLKQMGLDSIEITEYTGIPPEVIDAILRITND